MSKISPSSTERSGSEENGVGTRSPELTSGGMQQFQNTASHCTSYRPRSHPQRKRAKKDPNAPVKPLSAYLLFLLEKQEEIRRNSKDVLNVAETTKRVGLAWRQLPAETKKIFEEQAHRAKLQHAAEMDEYKKTEQYRSFLTTNTADSNSETDGFPRKPADNRGTPSTVNSSVSNRPTKRRKRDPETVAVAPKRRRGGDERANDLYSGISPAKVHTTGSGTLQEYHIPIWTSDFVQWNTQRERELKHVKKAADELDIDISGLVAQNEQTQRCTDNVNSLKSQLEETKKAKREVLKIIVDGMTGITLPSGMEIDTSNAEEYMTEVESVMRKSPGRHSGLLLRVTELAKKLQPFATYL